MPTHTHYLDRVWTGPKHWYYVRMDGNWTRIQPVKVNFHDSFEESYRYVRERIENLSCWMTTHRPGMLDLPFRNWPLYQKMLELGVTVKITDLLYWTHAGSYCSELKLISLRDPKLSTWMHEIGHAAEDKLRLKADEVVAETAGWVTRKMLGLNCDEYKSARYIRNYLGTWTSRYKKMSGAKRSVKLVVQELLS